MCSFSLFPQISYTFPPPPHGCYMFTPQNVLHIHPPLHNGCCAFTLHPQWALYFNPLPPPMDVTSPPHNGCYPPYNGFYPPTDNGCYPPPTNGLGLCSGTRFIVITVNRHRYQNRYGHSYSFDIHFDMFLTRYTRKMHEIYVFCSELCWKRLCWHVNCALPLFCAGARLSQCTRIQEISCWEDIEEAILVGIC